MVSEGSISKITKARFGKGVELPKNPHIGLPQRVLQNLILTVSFPGIRENPIKSGSYTRDRSSVFEAKT